MVSPSQKRHAAQSVVAAGVCSGRQACRYLGLARSTLAYAPGPPTPRQMQIGHEVVTLSRKHPRWGYRRVHAVLDKRGLRCALRPCSGSVAGGALRRRQGSGSTRRRGSCSPQGSAALAGPAPAMGVSPSPRGAG